MESIITSPQRKQLLAIRQMLDELIGEIPASNESEFNRSAADINRKTPAIRVWLPLRRYERGDIRVDPDDGCPYWAMHGHSSVEGAELQPSLSPTIWTHCHGTTPETARPFVAEGHNPYHTGHFCIEDFVVYRCKQDNTVYSPSVLPGAWEVYA